MMNSSYCRDDVTILLKDITGMVEPLPAQIREKYIQSGVHYSEMLPLEYKPTDKYFDLYKEALNEYSQITADAVACVSEKIHEEKKHSEITIVSLARAGTPIGILIKRYLNRKYPETKVSHYTISIIRGIGIDRNAMAYILNRHSPQSIQFVDGWIGKGAILNTLKKELEPYKDVSSELAVLADPAHVTRLYGTQEDFLIASSCLNSTVSGLLSRTFLRSDIIGKDDFHGAAYYRELADEDVSYEFIEAIEKKINYYDDRISSRDYEASDGFKGIDEVKRIADEFGIDDINLVKPGIGETTRVLLRRIPDIILVSDINDVHNIGHILRLAEEKNVKVMQYPLKCYKACGIIRKLADT